MPDIRAFMASGYFNGKIYLVGGYSTGNVSPAFLQTWEYDPVANTFATKTSIPAAVGFGGAGSGVINGHLYVAGGRDANITVIATLWDYDIAADTWTARANLPAPNNVPGSAVIGGKLWIFGGGNPFSGSSTTPTSANKGVRAWLKRLFSPDTTNALQVYDPATNSWTTGPSLNQQRSFPAGTDVGNTAVAVGGYDGSTTTTSVEINTDCVADLHARRYAQCMEHGFSIPDIDCALRLRADCHALLCVWWSVRWHASARRQPHGPCHRNVAIPSVDALCQ
jgi:hypothetical protein